MLANECGAIWCYTNMYIPDMTLHSRSGTFKVFRKFNHEKDKRIQNYDEQV